MPMNMCFVVPYLTMSIVLAQDHFYSVLKISCKVHMPHTTSMMMLALLQNQTWSSLFLESDVMSCLLQQKLNGCNMLAWRSAAVSL